MIGQREFPDLDIRIGGNAGLDRDRQIIRFAVVGIPQIDPRSAGIGRGFGEAGERHPVVEQAARATREDDAAEFAVGVDFHEG